MVGTGLFFLGLFRGSRAFDHRIFYDLTVCISGTEPDGRRILPAGRVSLSLAHSHLDSVFSIVKEPSIVPLR